MRVKVVEAMATNNGLESIRSISVKDILIESNCLEVVNLINGELIEVSFYVDEVRAMTFEFGDCFFLL